MVVWPVVFGRCQGEKPSSHGLSWPDDYAIRQFVQEKIAVKWAKIHKITKTDKTAPKAINAAENAKRGDLEAKWNPAADNGGDLVKPTQRLTERRAEVGWISAA